jgi:hypothetical protein
MKDKSVPVLLLCLALTSAIPAYPAAQKEWKALKGTHFIIYYQDAPEEFISQLAGRAEDYYKGIAEDLGFVRFNFWLWDERARIYIYDNREDYQSDTGQPAWSAGCAVVREKLILSFAYAQGFCETILPHEIAHIIFREFVGFANRGIPLWLDEGVANFHDKSKEPLSKEMLQEAFQANSLIPIEQLSNISNLQEIAPAVVGLFYAESFSIINFLIKQYGRDDFVQFCRNLRDKQRLNEALASAYGLNSLKELGQAWQDYLKRNFS